MKTHRTVKFLAILVLCLVFAQSAVAVNILENPGFESGTTGWYGMGCSFTTSTSEHHGGAQSGYAYNRTATWNGISQSLLNKMEAGKTYRISGWIMLENSPAGSESVRVTIKKTDDSGTSYNSAGSATGFNNVWIRIIGSYTPNVSGTLTALDVYFEGPAVGVNYYLDDVEIAEANDWKNDANARIEQIRKQDAQVLVVDPIGNPVADVNVQIEQIKHSFAFGTCIRVSQMNNTIYKNFILNHFNWAVCENDTKWGEDEPTQGNVTYTNADTIYNWCNNNGIKMRGHCLFWEQQNSEFPSWVASLGYATYPTSSALLSAVDSRINSAVTHFKDKFHNWDVDNEMLTDSFFTSRLGSAGIVHMFNAAKAVDPNCGMFMNEYNGNSFGGYDSGPYVTRAISLISQGATIDGFGIQAHLNADATFDPQRYYDSVLQPLAALDKPIWATEFDASHTNATTSADNIENFFRICFSHPNVAGIIMWGFMDGQMWRTNAGLIDSSGNLTVQGQRYEALMAEWTTNDSNTTNSDGSVNFRGFHGTYRITLTAPGKEPEVKTIELEPQNSPAEFTLELKNSPPVADAGPNQVAYAWIDGIADVTLDGSASYDDYTDELTYMWSWVIDGNTYDTNSVDPTIELPVGVHTIELVVNDGLVNSEPNQVVITVVEPIKSTMWVTPRIINNGCFDKQSIMAILQLPAGISKQQVDAGEKLLLYPGEIKANRQFVMSYYDCRRVERVVIWAYFDSNSLTDAVTKTGWVNLDVVGQLMTGQYFSGSDKVWVTKPPCKPVWRWPGYGWDWGFGGCDNKDKDQAQR